MEIGLGLLKKLSSFLENAAEYFGSDLQKRKLADIHNHNTIGKMDPSKFAHKRDINRYNLNSKIISIKNAVQEILRNGTTKFNVIHVMLIHDFDFARNAYIARL